MSFQHSDWIEVKTEENFSTVEQDLGLALVLLLENKQISTQRMSGNLSIILWEEP